MTKLEIKNLKTNELIIRLVDKYAVIVSKNGVRCNVESKELNEIANELVNRNILTPEDVEYLNK